VVDAALEVLRGLESAGGQPIAIERGGPIGLAAERTTGTPLPDEVADFCADIFGRGGAVLTGAGGGRYVYDLRTRFDLFLKLVPVASRFGLPGASPLRPESIGDVDLLLVRENLGGVYQGTSQHLDRDDGRSVLHSFETSESTVRPFLAAASRLAARRRGHLTVVIKQGGTPLIADLWRSCASDAAAAAGVRCSFVDVDLMAYQLISRPRDFDVIATSNLAGDILSDLAAALVGSRGLSFSGNFSRAGAAVYQTNHGAAHDIAGTDTANPVGQILSLAMLLRESLHLESEARAVESAVQATWSTGLRTADMAGPRDRVAGTREMATRIAEAAATHRGALSPAA